MIDPATGWFEIAEVPDFKAFPVDRIVNKRSNYKDCPPDDSVDCANEALEES
jgi:hypothetical protein